MEVVTREAFEAVPREFRKRLCGAANWSTYRRLVERQLTLADDASPHDICDDTPSSSWRIVPSKPNALSFGFALMNASEADDPVVS